MKKIVIDAWEARGENDTTEGRGGTHRIALFEHLSDATKAAEGKGVFGGNGTTKQVKESVCVYESYDEYSNSMNAIRVESFLNNMSDSDIDALKQHFQNLPIRKDNV